ncbi:THUMP domain-containing protein 1 isoform X1 [Histomonas meleagridis]|uniref:THUMP domain-containing protein 1-like isoform X1 n=1 Tax=Histomonas meleagridis TaxID=135588 RepID=UPI003559AE5A|nr:THUMP domain-containing protein 1 isoform X1 [Histomonas meleagridis]KAH0797557.1 THUMP domain-containing protein 1-like isoform X1 [Histomonas meleagridis]
MGKKKQSYFQNKKSQNLQVPPKGSKGVLITSDIHSINRGMHEAISVLERFSDPLPEEEQQQQETPAEESLESELAALRSQQKTQKARFVPYISEVTGNCFIRFTVEQDDPNEIVRRYFNYISQNCESLTKHVVRMYPILASAFPNSDESLPILAELLPKMFTPEKQIQYEIVIQRKHKGDGQKETHDELNQKIMNLVGQHRAVYHNGDSAILWISLGRNLYIGLVPDWKELCGCNVPKFCARVQTKNTENTNE